MAPATKPKIIVIVGPTGSGKTGLSLLLAEKFKGEVINADSRQVYKGLNIGTEKITRDEMRGIPHHLLDVVDTNAVYTAHQFKTDADTAIANIIASGNVPIVAGGTFFYIDTLLRKTGAPEIEPDFSLRAELEARDTASLFAELTKKDPKRANEVDPHNKRRIMRALEILAVLPLVPEKQILENPYDAFIIGLTVDKKVLRDQLRARAEKALERGLITETQTLLDEGVSRERLSEIGLEYRLVLEYLDGIINQEQLIQKLEEKNWQYAKRQLVWLKRDPCILWFSRKDTEAIFSAVTDFLAN